MDAGDFHFDDSRVYDETADSVRFFARAGDREVECLITRPALVRYFDAYADTADVAATCLHTYDRHALLIQGIARRLLTMPAYAEVHQLALRPHVVYCQLRNPWMSKLHPSEAKSDTMPADAAGKSAALEEHA